MLWVIGNTSVRSAFRLRDGLIALASSPLQGKIRKAEGDQAFRELLGRHGIVSLGEDSTFSVGRKWRSALNKCGFLYPKPEPGSTLRQEEIGPLDTITENGWRLIRSETVPSMQECFLRALAAQYIKGETPDGEAFWFSPLRHTLRILLRLEEASGEAAVNFLEMALIVQASTPMEDTGDVVRRILALREERGGALSRRRFDSDKYEQAKEETPKCKSAQTFRDYADANIRYLKATGLVQSKGRGIALVPEKRLFAELMAAETSAPETELERYRQLCQGAPLPTDDQANALKVLEDLKNQAARMDIPFSLGDRPLDTPADVAVIRHEIEDSISRKKEELYADSQPSRWEEIAAYLELIACRKDKGRVGERELSIPRAEAAAYLEWGVWRAFLALGKLTNKPYEARRFRIDQDFLPVGTAPGNGPDMIMEFRDFVLVVEVTLTESSRQEAAEGEPVRRHVADLSLKYAQEEGGKPVYGLFIANHIDSNTAETFRIGVWYAKDDRRMELLIIPVTLKQFVDFFRAMFEAGSPRPERIVRLMRECAEYRGLEAPEWKRKIGEVAERDTGELRRENAAVRG